jgi:ubiquinone/menaquinone biosynthesis C-methylase UbiE
MSERNAAHAEYGIDAPGVIRNLLAVGGIGLIVWATKTLGFWSGNIVIPVSDTAITFAISGMGLTVGSVCALLGLWMLWSSKVGKIRERDLLVDQIAWTGNERVLDVGCGRGLMLIGAAKRLTTGKAVGIDLWQEEDLTGNNPRATLENATREGVDDRVEVQTADMRKLPFRDGTFDVILSNAAIHNVYDADGRAKAITEIARVLKPGGQALIADIRHNREYEKTFSQKNITAIRRLSSPITTAFLAVVTMGSLRPASTLFRKD